IFLQISHRDQFEANPDIDNFGAYFRTCLENTLYKSQLKYGPLLRPCNKLLYSILLIDIQKLIYF
ncbi:hypothetical protein, partial [Peribacillus frigoritolerans]|uniref:hypothetical protein n=1 Tax=Peribacillus frigoritolerans TaxID=450367 RepID=UPI002417A2A3